MEMLNNAIEGADAFRKMLEKCEAKQLPTKGPNFLNRSAGHESRAERRERERFEKKQASRLARGLA